MQATKLIYNNPVVTNYAYSCSFFNINSIYAQSLRWKRKPIWLPTAKTKVFRVPQRHSRPEDETKEVIRLFNNYRTYYNSIRKYMLEIARKNEVQLDQSVIDQAEEEDYNHCMKLNDEWNKNIAIEREVRLENEREARKLKVLEDKEAKLLKKQEKILIAVQKVEKLKSLVPTFITRDNIDQAIEEALSTEVNHNKALDANGNWCTELPEDIAANKSESTRIKQ